MLGRLQLPCRLPARPCERDSVRPGTWPPWPSLHLHDTFPSMGMAVWVACPRGRRRLTSSLSPLPLLSLPTSFLFLPSQLPLISTLALAAGSRQQPAEYPLPKYPTLDSGSTVRTPQSPGPVLARSLLARTRLAFQHAMQRGVGTGDPEATETIQLGPSWTGALLFGAGRAGRLQG